MNKKQTTTKIITDHFETLEELLETCKMWINDNDYDGFSRFFEMQCMEALIDYIDKLEKKK